MLVTVIIPVHKPQGYFEECVNSLLNQSIRKNLVQIIFVLNGYTEADVAYVEKVIAVLSSTDYDVELLKSERGSVSLARNEGLCIAKGRFICFIDDDDCVSPNYLHNLLAKANDDTVVVSDVRTFTDDITLTGEDYISRTYAKFSHSKRSNLFLMRSFLSSACCKMIPIRVIQDVRFNPRIKNGEDSLFMFSISNSIKRISLASDATYYRRCRKDSASRASSSFCDKCHRISSIVVQYIKVYLKHPFQYNFLLFLSRLVASIHFIR